MTFGMTFGGCGGSVLAATTILTDEMGQAVIYQQADVRQAIQDYRVAELLHH